MPISKKQDKRSIARQYIQAYFWRFRYQLMRKDYAQVLIGCIDAMNVTKNFNPNKNGEYWEIALQELFLFCGAGQLSTNKLEFRRKNCDVDLLMGKDGGISIHAKTSLRERWKQVDRDALGINAIWDRKTHHICFIWLEDRKMKRTKEALERLEKSLKKYEQYSLAKVRFISVFMESEFNRAVENIIKRSKGHVPAFDDRFQSVHEFRTYSKGFRFLHP